SCLRTTNPASGRATATTTTVTHGESSVIRATEHGREIGCLAAGDGRRPDRRNRAREDDLPRDPRLARARRGTAHRRPAYRRGRLSDRALVLDRLGAGGPDGRSDRREDRRWRGVSLSHTGAPSQR